MGELSRWLNERGLELSQAPLSPDALAGLIAVVDDGTINSSTAKTVFESMMTSGRGAREIVQAEGLAQISDESAVMEVVRRVIEEQPDAVVQLRTGRKNTFGFLVGQVMRATGGKASPPLVNKLLRQELDKNLESRS
jgi:aspartyl-tRNA(Asn)/glutamyl-tRNA(Gln) amidotransferase subunit B